MTLRDETRPTRASGGRRCTAAAVSLAVVAGLAGCMRREMVIESTPTGALVTVNEVEVGRTPVRVGFVYYSTYDVRLEKDGYEPLRTKIDAIAPLYERFPVDLVAMAVPADIKTTVRRHFDLRPASELTADAATFERELVGRAKELAGESANPAERGDKR